MRKKFWLVNAMFRCSTFVTAFCISEKSRELARMEVRNKKGDLKSRKNNVNYE
jgi:hypothetical protein